MPTFTSLTQRLMSEGQFVFVPGTSDDSSMMNSRAATGEFNLVFEATESSSTFLVRGRFEVPKFKKDTWTTKYLPPVKFEQNGTDECGTTPQ